MEHPMAWFRYFIELYFVGVAKILPIVNPFSTIPLLLALTPGGSRESRAREARRSSTFASLILIGALFIGSLVIEFFGISLQALRIAGGLVISIIGLRMLFPGPEASTVADPLGGQGAMDIALIPLAMPSLSGPGSIAVVITESTMIFAQKGIALKALGLGAAVASIVTVGAVSWLVLRSSNRIAMHLGDHGIESIKRSMGFLLICIGVQYIASGIQQFFGIA
ncbi:MAG: MarC family NAAT transporter [Deltaproteobacteria bacterium]|nr:MarC family NAAT transporter [Deltaproteobacteria bacterium]